MSFDRISSLPARSWQQSTGGSKAFAVRIAELTRGLLGCYRTGDANDPATYSDAIILVFSDYPLDVIEAAVDPRSGLPSQCKWLPTVAEVKEFCEARMAPRRMQDQARKQLAEREQLQIEHHRPRPSYEELQRRCAEVGLMIGPKGSRLPPVDVAKIKQQYGISKEQWDAIPDART